LSNLTITIDEETLKKARIRALTEGTSVNEVLRTFLESYAGVKAEQAAALREIIEIARLSKSRSLGKRWTRDELYERK
jgi:plasmid stability protein